MTGFEAVLIVAVAIWIADAASGGVIDRAVYGAAKHAAAQGRAEMRRVKDAVIENSKSSLRQRIEDGEKSGPKSVWWWGVGAVRHARKVREALKGLRDGASGERSRSLPSAGPWRRIWDAAVAGGLSGARKAREEARERRAAGPSWRERARQAGRNASAWWQARSAAPRMDVCDDCGGVVAAAALERSGRMLRCVSCRTVPGVTGVPAVTGAGDGGDGADIVDAELVPEPAVTPPPIPPALPRSTHNDTNGAGELMAGNGQMVRRTAGAPAATGGGTGDLATHGDYDRYSELIAAALDVTTRCQEAMLGNLRAADAGRTQMADIADWSDRATATAAFIRQMVAGVDSRIFPVIDVISAQGGTHEVAKPGYYAQV